MPTPVPPRALQTLRILWGALAVSTGLLVFVLTQVPRPKVPAPEVLFFPMVGVAAGCLVASIVLPRSMLAKMKHRSLAAYNTTFIVGLALTESIALFGFILGFQNFPPARYYPFFAVAWIMFALRFPRSTHPLGYLGPPYEQG